VTGNPAFDLPLTVAGGVLVLGLLVLWLFKAAEWRNRRRDAWVAEAERYLALMVEDPTEDDPEEPTPSICPDCGRNAGHNEGCGYEPTLGRAALAIEIPREGEAQ
jgi:hypothetical protein